MIRGSWKSNETKPRFSRHLRPLPKNSYKLSQQEPPHLILKPQQPNRHHFLHPPLPLRTRQLQQQRQPIQQQRQSHKFYHIPMYHQFNLPYLHQRLLILHLQRRHHIPQHPHRTQHPSICLHLKHLNHQQQQPTQISSNGVNVSGSSSSSD